MEFKAKPRWRPKCLVCLTRAEFEGDEKGGIYRCQCGAWIEATPTWPKPKKKPNQMWMKPEGKPVLQETHDLLNRLGLTVLDMLKTGPMCSECGVKSVLTTGAKIYPYRTDLADTFFWYCDMCQAWCGAHANSERHEPYGKPAGKELRKLRKQVHDSFDVLWQRKMAKEGCTKQEARDAGYKWLREQLKLSKTKCHIGKFDEKLCLQTIELCKPYLKA